jgi:hypothetical protein
MIVITCEDGTRYGFEFDTPADRMRIVDGKVQFSPHEDVTATLEFPSPAVTVEEGE